MSCNRNTDTFIRSQIIVSINCLRQCNYGRVIKASFTDLTMNFAKKVILFGDYRIFFVIVTIHVKTCSFLVHFLLACNSTSRKSVISRIICVQKHECMYPHKCKYILDTVPIQYQVRFIININDEFIPRSYFLSLYLE